MDLSLSRRLRGARQLSHWSFDNHDIVAENKRNQPFGIHVLLPWVKFSLASQTLTWGESLVKFLSILFYIIISFLTRQEFLGVLIRLVTNGGAWLPFLACCLESKV